MSNTENTTAPPGVTRRMRPLAIASLALSAVGILSWFASIGLIAVPVIVAGLITGHLALGQIRREGGGGKGLAIAGLVIGYAGAAYLAFQLVSIFAFFGAWLLSGSH